MKKNIHFKKVTVAGFVTNIDNDEEKGAAHWDCNINLQLTKKVPVMFYNLRDYNSHLIFHELNKFSVKTDVIPNRLEKYVAFFKQTLY